MKPDIHPEWHQQAQVVCGCGNTWTTGATVPVIRTDVCSDCHPFFTGEQRIVDTAGQVERFMRRLEKRDEKAAASKSRSRGAKGARKAARRGQAQSGAPKAKSGSDSSVEPRGGNGKAPTESEKD